MDARSCRLSLENHSRRKKKGETMTLNNGSKDSVEPQNSGSNAAYVPKKGDIVEVEDFEGLIEVDDMVDEENEYDKVKVVLKGLSLARIEAEYVKKVDLSKIQRKRDEKLINMLGLLLSTESDLMLDEAKDEVRKVFSWLYQKDRRLW